MAQDSGRLGCVFLWSDAAKSEPCRQSSADGLLRRHPGLLGWRTAVRAPRSSVGLGQFQRLNSSRRDATQRQGDGAGSHASSRGFWVWYVVPKGRNPNHYGTFEIHATNQFGECLHLAPSTDSPGSVLNTATDLVFSGPTRSCVRHVCDVPGHARSTRAHRSPITTGKRWRD